MLSKITLALSVVTVILSAYVSLFEVELWLAGTQWMLISILCAVWSLSLKE
ncbi:MAG: hypothetical protein ACD_11C00017G0015 [uncultured bacterium]|nr:MAG: hypothetical protein ACD_11C00017G0015 [uncultured bacterium]